MFWEVDRKIKQNDAREGKTIQISANIHQNDAKLSKKNPSSPNAPSPIPPMPLIALITLIILLPQITLPGCNYPNYPITANYPN